MNQRFGPGAAVRAALQMTGSTYVMYAAGLLVSALIARSIGPEDFGRYSYMVWLSGVLVMISNNGLTTSGIRFVSESLGRESLASARDVHGWLQWRQYLCLTLVVGVYLAAMPFFRPAGWDPGHLGIFAAAVLVSMLAKAAYLFAISIAKGYGRFDIEALSSVAVSLLNVAGVVVLVRLHAPLFAYLALFAATSVGYAVAAALMLRRAGIRATHGALDPALRDRLKQHLFWTVVLTIAAAFSNKSLETYLLNALVGPAEVGFFSIAAALARGGVDLLSSGLTTVLMPSMAHAFGAGGQQRVNVILSYSMRYFQFLGLLLAGLGWLWADVAVGLMYGSRYEPVVMLLRIMVLVGGLALSEGAFGALLSTTDNQRLRAGFSTISIVVTAIAAFALIPTYGLLGAVYAHAISRLLVFALTLAGIVRILHLHLPWRELGRLFLAAFIAAIVAGVLVAMLPSLWTSFVAGLLYLGVFVGGTIVLRAWRATDADHLLTLIARFPGLLGRLQAGTLRWAAQLPQDD